MSALRWIRRLAPAVALLIVPASCGRAAPPPETPESTTAAPAPEKVSRGFFHQVRSPTATVYLLGSVHVGKEDLFPMDDAIEEAFAASETLVLELDLSEKARLETTGKALAESLYPPGQSLEQVLDAETRALLEQRLAERNLPLQAMNRMRPWVVAVALTLMGLERAGYAAEGGIDLHFARRAEGKKPIVGLETASEQLAIFTGMAEEDQVLLLRHTLETLDEGPALLDQAMAAWRASDEAGLIDTLLKPMRDDPRYAKLYDAVFVRRNVRMTRALEKLLQGRGTYFVVVGSGHVVGPEGIVARLRAAGHDVVQH
jgi:uncharacterized protein